MQIDVNTSPMTFQELIDYHGDRIIAISHEMDSKDPVLIPQLTLHIAVPDHFTHEMTYVFLNDKYYLQRVCIDSHALPPRNLESIQQCIEMIKTMKWKVR
jgi:hypothetical protein